MNIFVPLLITSVAGLSTVLGSLIIFFKIKKENINKFITVCLSLSMIVMILISITELLPVSIISIFNIYKIPLSILLVTLIPIISIISINYIDRVSSNTNNLYKLGIINMIVLILHNMPEGIITFLSSLNDTSLGIKLCIAIIMHNIPEGVAIAVPTYYGTGSKLKAIKMTFISGLAEPVGAVLTYLLFHKFITEGILSIILLFVGAIMIILSINKLFPEAQKLNEHKFIYLGILLGFILITLLELFF